MTEAGRSLYLEKQINLSINSENTRKVYYHHSGQQTGNKIPCIMCGSACVYMPATIENT